MKFKVTYSDGYKATREFAPETTIETVTSFDIMKLERIVNPLDDLPEFVTYPQWADETNRFGPKFQVPKAVFVRQVIAFGEMAKVPAIKFLREILFQDNGFGETGVGLRQGKDLVEACFARQDEYQL